MSSSSITFYVYLQPEVVAEAHSGGSHAMQCLTGILRDFLQNCCIVEFDDYCNSLKSAVEALPENWDRKIVKSLLVKLEKLHRFVYVLSRGDSMSGKADAELAAEQSEACGLDLLLVHTSMQDLKPTGKAELCTLANYQHSGFARDRSIVASDGITFSPGQCNEAEFLDAVFSNAVKHASGDIEICDCLLGEKFGDNFEYTIKRFIRWLEANLQDPDTCSLIIHCGTPKKATPQHIKEQLELLRVGRLAKMKITVQYYVQEDGKSQMPHERFILTDQFVLHLERGMDFLDRSTKKNRDAFVSMKSRAETIQLLESYKVKRSTSEVL